MTDQEYYDAVVIVIRAAGFEQPVDFDTVIDDKQNDKTVEECANSFIEEWAD